jgi:hypothetical protein
MFAAAAAVLVLVSLLSLGRASRELAQYQANESLRRATAGILTRADDVIRKQEEIKTRNQPLAGRIQKQFDLFKYRGIIPLLNEQLIACLPNAQNTSDQAALFDALDKGDVQAIKTIAKDRGQRKQVFITRVMIEYAADLPNAKFPDPARAAVSQYGEVPGVGGAPQPMVPTGGASGFGGAATGVPAAAPEAPPAGFVVLIEGYTPYRKVNDLLDPTGAANDPKRWGIVTRFENLGKIAKGTPFELFRKNDTAHFKVETDMVVASSAQTASSGAKQPIGIGVLQNKRRAPEGAETTPTAMRAGQEGMAGGMPGQDRVVTEAVLVDPMTEEEMSKTYDIITQQDVTGNPEQSEKDIGRKKYDPFGKEQYIERDSWFRIRAKFVWKGAPKVQLPVNSLAIGMPGTAPSVLAFGGQASHVTGF